MSGTNIFSPFDDDTVNAGGEGTSKSRGRVIAVASPGHSTGKTTIALLASVILKEATQAACQQGLRLKPLNVILVDMELVIGQVGDLTGYSKPTVAQLNHQAPLTPDNLKQGIVSDPATGVSYLLSPPSAKELANLTPGYYRDILQTLKIMFDVIVINTSEGYRDIDFAEVAYAEADEIVVVSTLKAGSIHELNLWVDTATAPIKEGTRGRGIPLQKIKVVLNNLTEYEKEYSETIAPVTAGRIVTGIPTSEELISSIMSKTLSTMLKTDNRVSKAVFLIASALLPDEVLSNPATLIKQ